MSDGNIILHTLIIQTEYLMVILYYIHFNTNRISDGHIILHTLITQTEYLVCNIILHNLLRTEYLMVILYYIHL